MDEKLNFNDFEEIYNALIEVEVILHELDKKLLPSRNYTDLAVIAQLKIKLDETRNIIIDECRKRFK